MKYWNTACHLFNCLEKKKLSAAKHLKIVVPLMGRKIVVCHTIPNTVKRYGTEQAQTNQALLCYHHMTNRIVFQVETEEVIMSERAATGVSETMPSAL